MDTEDLRAFLEVARMGNLTKASQRLGLSKAMVSRRLSRLESEVSVRLLSRTTRGVAITEAGATFKAHAETMLAALDAGREAIQRDQGEIAGRLRISASISFGISHLAPVLAELAIRYPKLDIHASHTDRFVDLIGERFDAAIRIGALPDSSLIARRIAKVRGVVVASPSYLERCGAPATPSDLHSHATIAQDHQIWRFLDGQREINFTPKPRFVADTGQAELAAAIAGVGIAHLPTFLCGPAIAAGDLQVLLSNYGIPEAGLYVVRPPPAGYMPTKITALIELLVERFGKEPYWDICAEVG